MTQPFAAMFFPETNPQAAEVGILGLVFPQLVHYRLPGGKAAADQGGEDEICLAREPAGLSAADQLRFQAMSRELAGNETEFYGGLLASLASKKTTGQEASIHSLTESLRSGLPAENPKESRNSSLWQAMLFLKLAEMLREKELEIARELSAISGQEAGLFAAIRGEAEELDEEEAEALRGLGAAPTSADSALNQAMLAKAWARIYLADPEAAAIPLLVATASEPAALLADACERITGKTLVELAVLAFPGFAVTADHRLESAGFRTENKGLVERFAQALLGCAANPDKARQAALAEAACGLQQSLRTMTQGEAPGKTLHFYACPGVSLAGLLAELTGAGLPPEKAVGSSLFAVLA